MNISPVFSIIKGTTVMAVPAPAGGFWKSTISSHRATFFGRSSNEVFMKARIFIVSQAGAA